MWMFVKVLLAMSAAAGIAAVPTALFSHHSESQTTGEVAVQSASDTHAPSHTSDNGSSHTSTSANTISAGTVTVYAGTTGSISTSAHGNAGGSMHGSGAVTKPHPVPPVQFPPNPQVHAATITWGSVKSVGHGHVTLSCRGQSDKTFTMDGHTRIVFVSGPLRPLDEGPSAPISRLHVGDNVMIVAKGDKATAIIDHGAISGRYMPLGGGSVQGGVNTRLSGSLRADGEAR